MAKNPFDENTMSIMMGVNADEPKKRGKGSKESTNDAEDVGNDGAEDVLHEIMGMIKDYFKGSGKPDAGEPEEEPED